MLLKGIHLLVYTMGKIFTLNEVLYIQARSYFFNFIGKRVSKTLKRKILFSIIHIIPNIENLNLEEINQKVGRLIHCLDALLKSFDQYEKEILICSIRGMNLIDYLPAYLQKFIKLSEASDN